MGVPKFYRWISERYPCLSEVVKEYQIPDFDNLYLDMNGIIHNCTHPNDEDVHFRMTEEQMFMDIFKYIEFLFRMIKPRKTFFMAIDGVAPRAKMNQQRGRRFRSALDAQKKEEEALKKGEELPKEARFDSNCITPGTDFMARLHEGLQWFVTQKMSTDEMWQGVNVILSGHETPGEGEHKIMDFIRCEKAKPTYDPNTRHCLYGLDADLIVLGLCSHEPHFSLLREEVKFIRTKQDSKSTSRTVNPNVITFHLLHLSLMRHYLDHEFAELKSTLTTFAYDLEKVIDDWILMGFLVGNDFIPHIPTFHINKNSLTDLYSTYIKVLPSLGGYLNEDGILNLPRFDHFLRKVDEIDRDHFRENWADFKFLEAIAPKPEKVPPQKKGFHTLEDIENQLTAQMATSSLDGNDDQMDFGYSDDEDEDELFDTEFRLHKDHYYETKMEITGDSKSMEEQAHGYIQALQWNLHYYYNGCVSWSWYFPHHYAPFISDVKDFSAVKLTYDIGTPFKPFEQLLAVLPAASKSLLPGAFQRLVTDTNSPLIENYPTDFDLDMNEKQQDWEAVVKIPFIDEHKLLAAALDVDPQLTQGEKKRNRHGPHLLFQYSEDPQPMYKAPYTFLKDIGANHSLMTRLDKDTHRIDRMKIRKGILSGALGDTYFPGFPTLKFIDHTALLRKGKVNVFGMCSTGDNMILTIKSPEVDSVFDLANKYLGKTVFVNWPHLTEAKVAEVTDMVFAYSLDKKGSPIQQRLEGDKRKEVEGRLDTVKKEYRERRGIVIGDTTVVFTVYPVTGRKFILSATGKITLEKEFSILPIVAPHQTIAFDIKSHDSEFNPFKTVADMFPVGATCFVLAPSCYGQPAKVTAPPGNNGMIKVSITSSPDPDFSEVIEMENKVLLDSYFDINRLGQMLGMHYSTINKLTGTIFVGKDGGGKAGRINVGLNLRLNSRGEEVPGFSKKSGEQWLLSMATKDILEDMMKQFPSFVKIIGGSKGLDQYRLKDLFPGENGEEEFKRFNDWFRKQPCFRADKQKIGAETLDSCIVKYIEKFINTQFALQPDPTEMNLTLMPNLLYRPLPYMGFSLPDPKANFELYDRVVNVRIGISVPLGLKGIIIGKHIDPEVEVNTVYDVLFDEDFVGGVALRCSPGRGFKMSPANMLNLTYGMSLRPKQRVTKQTILNSPIQPQYTNSARKERAQHSLIQMMTPNGHQNGSHSQNQQQQPQQRNRYHQRNGSPPNKSTPSPHVQANGAIAPSTPETNGNGNGEYIHPVLAKLFKNQPPTQRMTEIPHFSTPMPKKNGHPTNGSVSEKKLPQPLKLEYSTRESEQNLSLPIPLPVVKQQESTPPKSKKTKPVPHQSNPFVPMQVSRNQKVTPDKPESGKKEPKKAAPPQVEVTKGNDVEALFANKTLNKIEILKRPIPVVVTPSKQESTGKISLIKDGQISSVLGQIFSSPNPESAEASPQPPVDGSDSKKKSRRSTIKF